MHHHVHPAPSEPSAQSNTSYLPLRTTREWGAPWARRGVWWGKRSSAGGGEVESVGSATESGLNGGMA